MSSGQTYARIAGVLLLLSMIGGGLGEAYIPAQIIVRGNPAATARNIDQSEMLFRLGFATYLVEASCDIALSLVFYFLLRPVRKDLALLAAFFGLVSTSTYASAELFYFMALVARKTEYLSAFTPEQREAIASFSLRIFGTGADVFMVFYGIASFTRGYLMFRSAYLPKFLGVLLMLAGVGFVTRSFTAVLTPAYSSALLLLPMAPAGLSMMVWFLVKGVDVAKWDAAAAR